jgi:hypothetical protein
MRVEFPARFGCSLVGSKPAFNFRMHTTTTTTATTATTTTTKRITTRTTIRPE